MFQRVNYGPVTEKNAALPDLSPREWTVLAPIVAMAIVMGVVPNLFLRPIEPSVERVLNQIRQGAELPVQARQSIGDRQPSTVNSQQPIVDSQTLTVDGRTAAVDSRQSPVRGRR
jgi:hypothetical protein